MADPGAVTWVPGGLRVDSSTLVASSGAAEKVNEALGAAHQLTVEAWVVPANTSQVGPARIVTVSTDILARNLTLGQGTRNAGTGDRYDIRLRTTDTYLNGRHPLTGPAGSLTTTLQHVVYTRDTSGQALLYIDGVEVASTTVSGDLTNWDLTAPLALANEPTGDRHWLGTLHLTAIYQRTLTPTEITQNFQGGPD